MLEFIKFNLLKKNMIYMMVLISLSSLLVGCGNKNEDQSLWGRAEGKEVDVNHIGLRGQVKWRVSPHFVH